MPADFYIDSGDTQPVLVDHLAYESGSPVNLTDATVALAMRSAYGADVVPLAGTVTITGAVDGDVRYAFAASDTQTPGSYIAKWVVSFPDGSRMSFPTDGFITISVQENVFGSGRRWLVGLPEMKDYLRIPPEDRTHDSEILRYMEAATPLIEQITGPIVPRVFDEWHDGGQYFIQPRHRPSTALGTAPIFTLIAVEEFRGTIKHPLALVADPSSGALYSVTAQPPLYTITRRTAGGGVIGFSPMAESVHVVYEAGQAQVPPNVEEATKELVRVNYQTTRPAGRGRLTSSDEQDTGPPLGFFMPRRVRELLGPNRRAPSVA